MSSAGTDSRTLRLRDGRLLGYAEYGDPGGPALFYFHGFPGSRLEARLGDAVAARNGVRLIALDRPGFGLSHFKPGRTISEWPDDVVELADALGIDRFAVMGVSGGGPYVAACALKIPHRLIGAAMVSSTAPSDAPWDWPGARAGLHLGGAPQAMTRTPLSHPQVRSAML